MNSVNKFCRQNVGSLNVKSGGTHRYTPVHAGTRIVTTVPGPDSKLYPHLVRNVHCDRRRTRQLRNHFLKKKKSICVTKYAEITSGISPVRNGLWRYQQRIARSPVDLSIPSGVRDVRS